MSEGLKVRFVNNTANEVQISCKVIGKNVDFEGDDHGGPAFPIELDVPAGGMSEYRHLERQNSISSAPFSVVATFSNKHSLHFRLDAYDATNMVDRKSAIPITEGSNYYDVIQVIFPKESSADYNGMTVFLTPHVDTKCWMANFQDRSLTQLNIPGTHDSGTYPGYGAIVGTRCQEMDIRAQLAAGIRFFDLRLVLNQADLDKADNDRDNTDLDLGVFHADYFQYLWLKQDIMPVVEGFLKDNPTECVILCVNQESNSSGKKGAPFAVMTPGKVTSGDKDLLKNILIGSLTPNKIYSHEDVARGTDGDFFKQTLKDLAGRVVLIRRDWPHAFGFDASKWPDDTTAVLPFARAGSGQAMQIQDAYKYAASGALDAKWRNIETHLNLANDSKGDLRQWFVNFTSASLPSPIAGYFPWDFAAGGYSAMNFRLSQFLAERPSKGRYGTIVMDYPETPGNADVIRLLIASN